MATRQEYYLGSRWVTVFAGDEKLTTALLDRLAHDAGSPPRKVRAIGCANVLDATTRGRRRERRTRSNHPASLTRLGLAGCGPARPVRSGKGIRFTAVPCRRRRMNALPVDHFPAGVLDHFPSGVPRASAVVSRSSSSTRSQPRFTAPSVAGWVKRHASSGKAAAPAARLSGRVPQTCVTHTISLAFQRLYPAFETSPNQVFSRRDNPA
jgi:hypothetical protein